MIAIGGFPIIRTYELDISSLACSTKLITNIIFSLSITMSHSLNVSF